MDALMYAINKWRGDTSLVELSLEIFKEFLNFDWVNAEWEATDKPTKRLHNFQWVFSLHNSFCGHFQQIGGVELSNSLQMSPNSTIAMLGEDILDLVTRINELQEMGANDICRSVLSELSDKKVLEDKSILPDWSGRKELEDEITTFMTDGFDMNPVGSINTATTNAHENAMVDDYG
jgi:hypothetical protein